ncbi:MAG: heme ABC exporter ATP-binding protein CcmA [Robiginitomaculum sp.]|nr:heme ABC exporter ATP-binding protein CcmA [Robiginitomaculum sp.]
MHPLPICAIRCQNVGLSRGSTSVFMGVNFELHPANILIIQGENGSGKTSLLRVIGGFSQSFSGMIQHCFDTKNWINGSPTGNIGWLGHANAIKDELTVFENLKFWLPKAVPKEKIDLVMEKVQIKTLRHQRSYSLSAGERRRLALARLLLGRHPLWILDEPSANLDIEGRKLIEQLLAEHTARRGSAIIASHDRLRPDAPTSYIKLHTGHRA